MLRSIVLAVLLAAGQIFLATAVTIGTSSQLDSSMSDKTSIGASVFSTRDSETFPYPIGVATFTGEVNKEKFSIQGSAAKVLSELEKKHPEVDFEARAAARYNGTASVPLLTKRNTIYPPLCIPVKGQQWLRTFADMAYPCQKSLEKIDAFIRIPPRTCVRICCNVDARVFWCNDRYDNLGASSAYLGMYVKETCDRCMTRYWFFPRGACGGQLFDSDDWNVILRHTFAEPGSPEEC